MNGVIVSEQRYYCLAGMARFMPTPLCVPSMLSLVASWYGSFYANTFVRAQYVVSGGCEGGRGGFPALEAIR